MLAGQTLMSDLLLSLFDPGEINRPLCVQDQRVTHITDIQSDNSPHINNQKLADKGPDTQNGLLVHVGLQLSSAVVADHHPFALVGYQCLFSRRNAVC